MNTKFLAPIPLGMIGGGQGAFIGAVHRMAARLDQSFTLVAGALSSRPEVSLASAAALGIASDRAYGTWQKMAKAEPERPDGIRAVAIVTPNHMHLAPALAFMRAGIHVICDKPLSATLEEAEAFAAEAATLPARFLLTHNYTGYPLIRQARAMVAAGQLGALRLVQVEYPQDWLATEVHSKQADWRTDPARSGAGGSIGDIGTHAYNLARFVTGLVPEAISADLHSFVPGRAVDDNVNMLLRFENGARGMLWASQVAVGHENGLRLRVYGDRAAIDWVQAEPNGMWFSQLGQPRQWLTRGGPSAFGEGAGVRIPAGHPEGFIEAFATLYQDFAEVIRADRTNPLLPTLDDGIEGMRFISAAIRSSLSNGVWTSIG
jgi:predicted dehydrogenase